MADTDIASATDFQTRMFNRIREQMGELLTDAELKTIVDKAIEKAFFEERYDEGDKWGNNRRRVPPHFVKLVDEHLQLRVRAACDAWFKENPAVLEGIIADLIGKGMVKLITDYLERKTQDALYTFGEGLKMSLTR